MKETKKLLTEKLKEKGDSPEEINCAYTLPDETVVRKCTLDKLPDGYLEFFHASSKKYLYSQAQDASGNFIRVLDVDYSDVLSG